MTTADLHQRYLAAQAATLAGDALQELDMRSIERRDTGESAARVYGRDGISVCCSSAISKGCPPSGGLRGGWPIR